MNKTDELNITLSQNEAHWREVEQKASSHCPQLAAALNALFASAEQFAQAAQNIEAKGLRFSTSPRLLLPLFRFTFKAGLLHVRLSKVSRKFDAAKRKWPQ